MSSIDRRQFLALSAGVLAAPLGQAACRDERGMIGADWDDEACHRLHVREDIRGETSVARAAFGMAHYEKLTEMRGEWFHFKFGGLRHRIRVTRVSVDVDAHIGCVVVNVDGAYAVR